MSRRLCASSGRTVGCSSKDGDPFAFVDFDETLKDASAALRLLLASLVTKTATAIVAASPNQKKT